MTKRYNGFRLKYYAQDHQLHAEEYAIKIDTQEHVTQIVDKLCRHFGLPKIEVNFIKCRRGSACYKYYKLSPWDRRIDFSWGKTYPIDIATICHEMSHYYLHFKGKPFGHTKRLTAIQERMLKYCANKGYWGWTLCNSEKGKTLQEPPFSLSRKSSIKFK